ncbi:uncharacterized protein LOC100906835, partial [Galendromus occidentalis]|uniref:Uncharacterized protein LOC100906835 n=1 Tax=Galendromus occidentalis TaxID=34638 RepID=A0AAJ7WGN8_9ACAR
KPLVISYRIDTPACKIPEFSPFDFSVVNLYERQEEPSCAEAPSFLKWTSYNILNIDEKIVSRHYAGIDPSVIKCFFREIYRDETSEQPDKKVFFRPRQELVLGEEITSEFILVDCLYKSWTVLEQYMLVPVMKENVERRAQTILDKTAAVDRTNVLVLGVDSVSYLNAYRHLRNSLAYVRTELQAVELRGYVKVGDNSFPNQNPLIDGMNETEAMGYSDRGFFDRIVDRMIWSEFMDVGYRSLFLEESPSFGLYHYHLKGFKRTPADYYTYPLLKSLEKSPLRFVTGGFVPCHAGSTTTEMYLDYINRFAVMLSSRQSNFFAYVWLSDIPHDKMNAVGNMDSILTRHIKTLARDGVLNNTALVFLSDHGIRFDTIRTTTIGKYEDRMPFAFVAMPRRFCESHPKECGRLESNALRLTTHYDVHAALRDLIQIEGPVPGRRAIKTNRGVSLFSEIPFNRTCSDASIDPMWCTCAVDTAAGSKTGELPAVSGLAHRLAIALEKRLNSIVDKRLCHTHALSKVLEVQRVQGPNEPADQYFWVTASFSPGNSIFEATVVLFKNGSISAGKSISRCNMYWGTAWCVADHWMEKFCHCKSWYTSFYFLLMGG